jgi:Fungal specific transcription factor domain/Fungal Zn(2)-Cys(6) binuclear cluster domain
MVGVAGKSKGCSTCRRRKKGCDLGRPTCGQCLKSGNVCGGYERELVFIHHKAPNKARQRSLVSQPHSSSSTSESGNEQHCISVSNGSDSRSPSRGGYSPFAFSYENGQESSDLVQLHSLLVSPSPQVLSPTLTLTALTSLHTSLFNSFYLPRNSFAIPKSAPLSRQHLTWTQYIPSLLQNDLSLQFAYLALSSSRVGHDNHDAELLASAGKFYGKAIRELQRALADPKRRYTDEVILACSLLGLYEIFEAQTSAIIRSNNTTNGWLSHMAGAARLLEARGPQSFTTDMAHQVFLNARIFVTIRAATSRKACFLSKPEWLTIPWQKHPKTLQHKMIDIMVFVPLMYETFDNLEMSNNLDQASKHQARQRLLAHCCKLDEHLQDWIAAMRIEADGQPLWQSSESRDPSYPFPHIFSFDDLNIAFRFMLYWACRLVIQTTICQLRDLLNAQVFSPDNKLQLPNSVNPWRYACYISQSLPYILHPDMGALGPNVSLFPVGMAFAFFAVPRLQAFVPDWAAPQSPASVVDDVKDGKDTTASKSTKAIILWYVKLFDDLKARNMPGGDFLAGLMKAVGQETPSGDFRKVFEV